MLTGRLIAQGRRAENGGTTCHMHTQELVLQHALGIRRRSRLGEIHDEFPPGKELKEKVKKIVSLIMNKLPKNRFKKYQDYCKKNISGIAVRKLVNPNDTRVSGIYHMFESVLRSYKCITRYMTGCDDKDKEEFQKVLLTPTEWQFMAELYAVMKVMNVLAMTSQKQSVDSNCFSYFSVAYSRFFVETTKSLKVIDICYNIDPTVDVLKIPTNTLQINQLQENTQTFITRLVKEFNSYFSGPDGDQVKMMAFHPVMVWRGFL